MQNTIPTGDPFFDDLTPDEMKITGYLLCGFHEEDILRQDTSLDKDNLPCLIASILKKNEVKTQAELQAIYFGPLSEDVFMMKAAGLGLKERATNAVRMLLQGVSPKRVYQNLGLKNYRHFFGNCFKKLGIGKAEEIFVLFHDDSVSGDFCGNHGFVGRNRAQVNNPFNQKVYDYFNQLTKGKLSHAELETIPYIFEGGTNKAIADRIPYISIEGCNSRLKSIFKKFRELGLYDITTKEKLQAQFYLSAYVWNEERFQQRCAKAKLGDVSKMVVRGLLEGKTNKEIARMTGMSPERIGDRITGIHHNLGIASRKEIFAVFYGDMEPIESISSSQGTPSHLQQQAEALALGA